ncbi:MAG: hypothetical protein DCC88_03820 [Spirobacillus cienkowskii]|jgi:hypothetical protein|uniref:Type II methyltransferase M.TaqI-like domain-containing protein n=1 Tax=Spirobacillus cienkowskii TaxID=495820 RepID=A0A369KVF1_9BACT|nr:MAG: hypothetical protein DCC88_03820 [Spirobacillus cienkowskii]
MPAITIKPTAHVVDVLGNVIGRDQPILRMEKALEMVSLLGSEVFEDQNIVFFDPFCKAGELLLACAFYSSWAKAKNKPDLLDMSMVFNEIFLSNRYFGLAPDERHHRLSIRTFLGNKNSHDEKFNHIIRDGHYLSEIDGKLNKEKFDKEFNSMIEYIKKKTGNKKIIAVGNPPYQENYKGEGNNTGANPIYHIFLDKIIKSELLDQFLMVTPSRWFAGGRGKALKTFALELRESKKLKQIYDFQDSKQIFPTVEIKGGVCFLHWDKNYNGKTKFFNKEKNTCIEVDLSEGDLIIRDGLSLNIVNKVKHKADKFISEIAWSWNPFNLPSNYFDKNLRCESGDLLECFTKRGVIKKINKNKIVKNFDKIGKFKVTYPKAVSKGGIPHRPDQIFILNKKQVCTETYMIIDAFDTKDEAENLLKLK